MRERLTLTTKDQQRLEVPARRLPNVEIAVGWVGQAKKLPRVVDYGGETLRHRRHATGEATETSSPWGLLEPVSW
jgi:hypothetical protein